MQPVRILALDTGTRRIGVAMSDELGITAQGLDVIKSRGLEEDIRAVRSIVEEYGVTEIIVSLPKRMDGSEGEGAKQSEMLAAELRQRLGVEVRTWDERLSTSQAERHLIAADVSRKRRKQVIDKVAACLILQNYLDWRSMTGSPHPPGGGECGPGDKA